MRRRHPLAITQSALAPRRVEQHLDYKWTKLFEKWNEAHICSSSRCQKRLDINMISHTMILTGHIVTYILLTFTSKLMHKKKIRINREKRKANIPNEILSYVYSFICVSAFPYEWRTQKKKCKWQRSSLLSHLYIISSLRLFALALHRRSRFIVLILSNSLFIHR